MMRVCRGWVAAVMLPLGIGLMPQLVLPAAAGAQNPIIGGMARGRPTPMTREPGITVPKYVNPVNLLVEHRQEVALSDSQFMRVLVIKRALDSTNANSLRKLDSLQRLFRGGPIFSEPTVARRDSIAEGQALADKIVADVRENVTGARERAYALLSITQLARAQELESKAEKAIEEESRKPARGRGGIFGRPPRGG